MACRHLISATFGLCLSVGPSVRTPGCAKHDSVRTQRAIDLKFCTQACIIHTLVGMGYTGLQDLVHISQIGILGFWADETSDSYHVDWFTGSGTFHISQIVMLGSSAHGTSDSHQISDLGLVTNSKCDYQKLY